MKLTDNFTLEECEASETAARLGINNRLPRALVTPATLTATNVLEPIRHVFGPFSPSSWYRCEALERAICWGGRADESAFAKWCRKHGRPIGEEAWREYFGRKSHPSAEAVDIKIVGVDTKLLYNWCLAKLDFDQLILEFHNPMRPSSGWVHVSYRAEDRRHEAFSIG